MTYDGGVSKLKPPLYIDNASALESWVEHCSGATIIGVDTEADSLHSYKERCCLIQMTALGQDAIVDPLALDSLEPLRPIFENPDIIKIFHDAGYDLIGLSRDFGFEVRGIFDTMAAARLLGWKAFGLAAILREHFDFEADKRWQRSDWGRRPLLPDQIAYARYDTHFLLAMVEKLTAELKAADRWEWAQEDFKRIPETIKRLPNNKVAPEEAFWRIKGLNNFKPEVLGRVQALQMARDAQAERLNRPAFKIFGDKILIELAKEAPTTKRGVGPRPGLREGGVERFASTILKAIQDAKPYHGKAPKGAGRKRRYGRLFEPDARQRYEDLRSERIAIAENLKIEPDVLLSNATLEDLARDPLSDFSQVSEHPNVQGWRKEIVADRLFKILKKST